MFRDGFVLFVNCPFVKHFAPAVQAVHAFNVSEPEIMLCMCQLCPDSAARPRVVEELGTIKNTEDCI